MICCYIGPNAHLNSPSHEHVIPWYSIITIKKNYYVHIYIKFLQCMSDFWCLSVFFNIITNPYISAKKKDNDTKLSGYHPWGLPSTYITYISGQEPSTSSKYHPSWHPIPDTLLTKISNFQGIFHWVNSHQFNVR